MTLRLCYITLSHVVREARAGLPALLFTQGYAGLLPYPLSTSITALRAKGDLNPA